MFDFEKINVSKFYSAPTQERVVQITPDIDPANVSKVLSLATDAKCTGAEVFDGYVNISGRVNFRLVYLDGEGAPRGVDYNADFEERIDGEFECADNVRCDIAVVESEVEADGMLMLSCVLEICVGAIKRDEVEALVGAQNCYETKKDINYPVFVGAKAVTLPFDDEQNVGGEIERVLCLTTSCAVQSAKAIDGEADVKLNLFARVTYCTDGKICTRDFDIPIEEQITIDGLGEDDKVAISCVVKNAKVVLQGVTDDNVIRVEGEVQIRAQAFGCAKATIIEDVFMLTNETEIAKEKTDCVCFDGCEYYAEQTSGTFAMSDNKPTPIEVCALPYAHCYLAKSYMDEDGNLVVEGVVNSDVIYRDENGYNCVRAEIPFSNAIALNQNASNDIKARCEVVKINATLRRERELFITADLRISACGLSLAPFEYISQVDIGAEHKQNTSALSVYVVGEGESMLDVCKALSAMPEDICAQNPDVAIEKDARIVYFRTK